MDTRRPCPCCGHLVFDTAEGWPGSGVLCPVCLWEDDLPGLRRPFTPGRANRVPLIEAQRNFRAYGARDQRARRFVRPPGEDEPLDTGWRPIDPRSDLFDDTDDGSPDLGGARHPEPADPSRLCWWLPSYRAPEEPPGPDPARRVVIDVSRVRDEYGLHAVLKRDLGFPWFYGMNWNAFRDAVTGLVELPRDLRFTGWAELERRCPGAAMTLRRQLAGFEVTYEP
ncbi:CPCC family cysteine-rich protein [Kitasatospora sp. NPDC058032]|uniref:CPCC family cysteine-rich protein n=1 Tax=Kitasatospora sp. NPDC058032 TaxID=3346307 RepID=UPI0036DBA802